MFTSGCETEDVVASVYLMHAVWLNSLQLLVKEHGNRKLFRTIKTIHRTISYKGNHAILASFVFMNLMLLNHVRTKIEST